MRREAVVSRALDHAIDVMTEVGVGGLSVVEVARRMDMRGPSLYKYFPSLTALYDALFARGLTTQVEAVRYAALDSPPGAARVRAGGRALVRWATDNPALAQLLFWRVVPSFQPSAETMAISRDDMAELREQLAVAVRQGELRPEADSDDAVRLWTVLLSGVISQQMANEPGATFEEGAFSRLTDAALDLFFTTYRASPGGAYADTGP